MNLMPAYRDLLFTPRDLAICRMAGSMSELLNTLKTLFKQEHLSDECLIAELNRCNRIPVEHDLEQWHGRWMPYSYHAKDQLIAWCLPLGAPSQPFHDEYTAQCRQQLPFNQLIRPRTSLDTLLNSRMANPTPPNGFIFHLSRCGSTLISGCLSEIEQTSVLSESSLLTEILLDASLARDRKIRLLRDLVSLQGIAPENTASIVIKWNAWDLLFWPLIHSAFPTTPTLLVIRDPLEILASHARGAGRHMAGDPALAHLGEAFDRTTVSTVLEFRVSVLRVLLEQAAKMEDQTSLKIVDYTDFAFEAIEDISRIFNLPFNEKARDGILQRMRLHSKIPDQPFTPDREVKQQFFNVDEKRLIHETVFPLYVNLVRKSTARNGKASYAG